MNEIVAVGFMEGCLRLRIGKTHCDGLFESKCGMPLRRSLRFTRGSWTIFFCLFLSLSSFLCCAVSQVIPPGAQTGSPVNSSNDQHGIDSVNTENLGLHIEIPLLSIQERGRTYTVEYVYNSPIYTIQFYPFEQMEPDGETGNWAVHGPLAVAPNNWNIVTPNDWQLADDTAPEAYCTLGAILGGFEWEEYVLHTNYRLIDPEGTQHPLAMEYYDVIGSGTSTTKSYDDCAATESHLTSPTLDGTAAEVDLTQNAMWLADGTRYTVDDSYPDQPRFTKAEDRNGNILYQVTGPWTDMMNRTVLKQTVSTQSQDVYQYTDSNGEMQSITINYVSVPYQTDDCSIVSGIPNSIDKCFEGSGTYRLPQSIILPNAQQYTFSYNSGGHGELKSMTLPSGAAITYTYQRVQTGASERTGSKAGATGYSPAYFHYGVSQRTVIDNGVPALWQYTTTNDGSEHPSYTTTVEDPNGNCAVHSYGTVDSQHLYGLGELETIYESGCGSTASVLQRVVTSYSFNEEAAPDGTLDAYFLRPHTVTTTLAGGESSQVQTDYETFTFDGGSLTGSWDSPTEVREYDFGASTPTRITDYTYIDQVGSSTRTAAQYFANHIINKVVTKTVSNSSGALVKTAYDYDNYGSAGISRSAAYDLDTTYGNWGNITKKTVTDEVAGTSYVSSYTYEDTGNMLSSTDPRGLTTHYSWGDEWGNATCALTNGQQGHVYLTSITNAASQSVSYTYNSCSGTLATSMDANSQKAIFAYDGMGRTTQISYPDGGATSFSYQDTVPLQMTVATAINQTTTKSVKTTYDGLFHPIEADLTSDPDGTEVTITHYDALGRVSSISNPYRSSSDPTYGITQYTYDALGRKTIQTQPDGSKLQWCYDGIASTGQTNCSAHIGSVNGSWMDSTDESGKHWQRTNDGLGRLAEVIEDASGAKMETDYHYDALDDLTRVDQWGGANGSSGDHVRTFSYDSLSRLVCASNPENSSSQCPAQAGAYTAGTTGYSYDANGNIISKTSPAPNSPSGAITTSYTYDALNRVLSKRSTDGAATPAACYQYDQSSQASSSANMIGRLANEWTQSATANNSTCAATMPTSGTTLLTSKSILSYDPMGRIKTEQTCVYPTCTTTIAQYPMAYTYDLAGNITSYTNGNDSILYTKTYDNAGRLSSTTSTLTGPKYPSPLFSSPTYSPAGSLSGATYGTGTGITLCRSYDNKLRVTGEVDTEGATQGASVCPAQ